MRRIGAALAERMRTSHRPGCPVPLRDLRYLRMTYRDFDGRARTGEMVVHRRHARGVTRAFGRLYDAGWPIARMRLVDDYGGDDDRSMAANNTSGFNCRRVAGQADLVRRTRTAPRSTSTRSRTRTSGPGRSTRRRAGGSPASTAAAARPSPRA